MRKGSTKGVKGKVEEVGLPSPHPTKEKAHEINQAIEDLRVKYGDDLVNLAVYGDGLHGPEDAEIAPDKKAGASQFPVRLYPKDDYDKVMQVKMAASQDPTLKNWQKDFTTQDAQWLLRKAEAQTGAAFKAWLSTLYDARDPYQAELLNKVFPELSQEQDAVLQQRADLGLRIAKMRLHGPKEPEDLRLLYAIASGAVTPPRGEIWKPESWFRDSTQVNRLQRGLFSPFAVYVPSEDRSRMPMDKIAAMMGSGTTPGVAGGAGAATAYGSGTTVPIGSDLVGPVRYPSASPSPYVLSYAKSGIGQ